MDGRVDEDGDSGVRYCAKVGPAPIWGLERDTRDIDYIERWGRRIRE